jgi:hypothetical protein
MTDERAPESMGTPDPAATTPTTPDAAPPPLAPLVAQPAAQPAAAAPAAAQPAVAWAPPPATTPVAGQRTVLALIAGMVMIVGAILFGLAGLAVMFIGRAVIESMGDLGQIPGLEGVDAGAFASGVMIFAGILIVALSATYLIGGIGIVRNRNWGRIIGLVVGILGGLLWLSAFASPTPESRQGIGGSLFLLAIHVYIVVALLFFWRPKPASA